MVGSASELKSTLYYGVPITPLQYIQLILTKYDRTHVLTDEERADFSAARDALIMTHELEDLPESVDDIMQDLLYKGPGGPSGPDGLSVVAVPHDHDMPCLPAPGEIGVFEKVQYYLVHYVHSLPRNITFLDNQKEIDCIFKSVLGKKAEPHYVVINNDCSCCS